MHRARKGFTLIEMSLVVAIIAISVALATLTFGGLKRSERRREIIRTIMSLSAQARTIATQLGPAAGTPRATLDPTCMGGLETVFSRSGTALNGRAAIAFQSGVNTTCTGATTVGCCPDGEPLPCDLVVLVSSVARGVPATPWNGDNYVLSCKSYALGEKEGSILNTTGSNLLSTTAGGVLTQYVAFDARGFVSPAIAPAARVGVHSPTGRANTPRGVVNLASGLACPESTPFQCARM